MFNRIMFLMGVSAISMFLFTDITGLAVCGIAVDGSFETSVVGGGECNGSDHLTRNCATAVGFPAGHCTEQWIESFGNQILDEAFTVRDACLESGCENVISENVFDLSETNTCTPPL